MTCSTTPRELHACGRVLRLGERPLLMGIVNATPDSFSDPGEHAGLDAQVERALELTAAGAEIIDVGGESGVTNRPTVDPAEEIARVVPLIERLARDEGVLVSVDTYKPEVAAAAVEAGAAIVNDVSGLRDPALAEICAASGAALVLMHTRAAPKAKLLDHDYGPAGGVMADVVAFLSERIDVARQRGIAFEQLMLDPGPDFAKSPAQTVELLRDLSPLHELGRPILLAVSRKDFVGAITGRAPRARLAGTLAALAHGVQQGGHVFRMHDVEEAADFLRVSDALRSGRVDPDATSLAEHLRREPI